jgi:hypothetical protein
MDNFQYYEGGMNGYERVSNQNEDREGEGKERKKRKTARNGGML